MAMSKQKPKLLQNRSPNVPTPDLGPTKLDVLPNKENHPRAQK